mmetsp:Transcript_16955/g.26113  ORF Transcript_16955/g.26113 Transcript_16955/m.26113 type:complete len:212 (-) Transcript_16955:405-1040(-)
MVHGFGEYSSAHLEGAIHHALNGFEVVMVDLYGFGLSYGTRGTGWSVHDQHENVGVMLQKARTDLPLFMFAHSMGCMVTQSFLIKNASSPDVKKIAGVIFNAPFFEFTPLAEVNFTKKVMIKLLSGRSFDNMTLNSLVNIHWITHSKYYWVHLLSEFDGKGIAITSPGILAAWIDAIHDIEANYDAHQLPFLIVIGGKDKVVDNLGARKLF